MSIVIDPATGLTGLPVPLSEAQGGTGSTAKITLGTAVSATGTSVDFTGIPSWVKRITVMLDQVSTNGTSLPIVQIGDSGGVEVSGYLGSAVNITNAVTTSNNSTGFKLMDSGAATVVHNGSCILHIASGTTWVFMSNIGNSDVARFCLGAGSKSLSATLDRIRLTTVNGTDTFDAGTVNILYEG